MKKVSYTLALVQPEKFVSKIRILGDSNTTYVQQKFKECHLSIYAVNDVNGMSTILRGCLEAVELNYIMHYFEASHMSLHNGLK